MEIPVSVAMQEVEIIFHSWESLPLGLEFVGSEERDMHTVGKLHHVDLPQELLGSAMVEINGKSVRLLDWTGKKRELELAQLPVTISFEKPKTFFWTWTNRLLPAMRTMGTGKHLSTLGVIFSTDFSTGLTTVERVLSNTLPKRLLGTVLVSMNGTNLRTASWQEKLDCIERGCIPITIGFERPL